MATLATDLESTSGKALESGSAAGIPQLEMHAASDMGRVRDLNEDTVIAAPLDAAQPNPWQIAGLLLVADGMGRHHTGEVASGLAADLARQIFLTDQAQGLTTADVNGANLEERVAESVRYINRVVHRQGTDAASSSRGSKSMKAPGTTLTLALVRPQEYCIAHAGDSRAYLIHAPAVSKGIRQLTEDDSVVAEAMRRGDLTAEQARTSPFRNHITKAIGIEAEIEPAVFSGAWESGDVLLLCTDGLTEYVTPAEITEFVHNSDNLQAACRALVAIANHRGGQDNISVVAARNNFDVNQNNLTNGSSPINVSAPSAATIAPVETLDQNLVAPDGEVVNVRHDAAIYHEDVNGTTKVDNRKDTSEEEAEDFASFQASSTVIVEQYNASQDKIENSSPINITSPMNPGKSPTPKPPAPRASTPKPAAPRSSPSSGPRPEDSKLFAQRPTPRGSSGGRASGTKPAAVRLEGNRSHIKASHAILIGVVIIGITAASMVMGVRSGRNQQSAQPSNGTNNVAPAAATDENGGITTQSTPDAVTSSGATGATSSSPGTSGTAAPISIWLDSERKAIIVASKNYQIKAESGSNGNRTRPDADRPTRTLISFRRWEVAYKQLQAGDAELVCLPKSQVAIGPGTEPTPEPYKSAKDDAGHVKIQIDGAPLTQTYSLQFRKIGDADGQELATFSVETVAASESGTVSNSGTESDSNPGSSSSGETGSISESTSGNETSSNDEASSRSEAASSDESTSAQ